MTTPVVTRLTFTRVANCPVSASVISALGFSQRLNMAMTELRYVGASMSAPIISRLDLVSMGRTGKCHEPG